MARYTLTVFDNTTSKKYLIKLNENGKLSTKVDITTLDLFFVDSDNIGGFENKEAFRVYLNNQINDENKQKYNISKDSAVYISYISNKRRSLKTEKNKYSNKSNPLYNPNEKQLPIIYKGSPIINYFAYECNKLRTEYFNTPVKSAENRKAIYGRIMESEAWKELYKKTLVSSHSGKFCFYLKDKSDLGPYCYDNLINYATNRGRNTAEETEAYQLAIEGVKHDLLGYKNIRAMQVAFTEYNKVFGYNFGLDPKEVETELVIAKTNAYTAKMEKTQGIQFMNRQYTKEEYEKLMDYKNNSDPETPGGMQKKLVL